MPFGKLKVVSILEPLIQGPDGFQLTVSLTRIAKMATTQVLKNFDQKPLDACQISQLLRGRMQVLKYCYEVDGQTRLDRTEAVLDCHQAFGLPRPRTTNTSDL